MKNVFIVFIFFLVGIGLFLFLRFIVLAQADSVEQLKGNPVKFVYFLNRQDSSSFISLVSSDTDCMYKIRKFYEGADFKGYLPGCFEHGIPVNDKVYLSQSKIMENDPFVKIAYFYDRPNGTERYFIGYIDKLTLHDQPYERFAED